MSSQSDYISFYQNLVEEQLKSMKMSTTRDAIEYPIFYFHDNFHTKSVERQGYKYVLRHKTLPDKIRGELIRLGWLIKLGQIDGVDVYTTLHADIVFRVIRGRAYHDNLDGRWVGYYDIDIEKEWMPDYEAARISELQRVLEEFFKKQKVNDADKLAAAICKGLEDAGIRSLARWQLESIRRILEGALTTLVGRQAVKHFEVVAPTASGKTLVFQIAALSLIAASKATNAEDGHRVLLLYPRRALQRQQLERILKPLHYINRQLKQYGFTITIGIDQGVEEYNATQVERDTGIKCPHADNYTIKYSKSGEAYCADGDKLDYLVGIVYTREDREKIASINPDILISNPWTLKSRLLSPDQKLVDLYASRDIIVLDEAHVYTDVNYLELAASIRLHYHSRRIENKPTLVIALSATMPKELLKWLLKHGDVDVLRYHDLEPENPRKRLKILVSILPYRLTQETTLQGVVQVISTATLTRSLKSIVFIDSISEAATIYGYLKTIYEKRRAREITDHIEICDSRPHPLPDCEHDDYSWAHYVHSSIPQSHRQHEVVEKLQNYIRYIGLHHGGLEEDERRRVEQQFAQGQKRLLISTSTLDLGIDYDDVAFIVQYKDPADGDILEQRIGRAGRRDETARIALCFHLPTPTPSLIQKMYQPSIEQREKEPLGDTVIRKGKEPPDDTVVTWMYLQQVVEYELLKEIRRAHIRNYKTLVTKVRSYFNDENLQIIKKWLPEFDIPNTLKVVIESIHLRDIRKEIKQEIQQTWRELMQYTEKKKYLEIVRQVLRDITRNTRQEKDSKKIVKKVLNNVKDDTEDLRERIKECGRVRDYLYDPDLMTRELEQCLKKLSDTLKNIKQIIEECQSLMKSLTALGKASDLEVEITARCKSLGQIYQKVQEIVERLERRLNDGPGRMAVYYLLTKEDARRHNNCYICRNVTVSVSTNETRGGGNLFYCWYYCWRPRVVSELAALGVTPTALREFETVSLTQLV